MLPLTVIPAIENKLVFSNEDFFCPLKKYAGGSTVCGYFGTRNGVLTTFAVDFVQSFHVLLSEERLKEGEKALTISFMHEVGQASLVNARRTACTTTRSLRTAFTSSPRVRSSFATASSTTAPATLSPRSISWCVCSLVFACVRLCSLVFACVRLSFTSVLTP